MNELHRIEAAGQSGRRRLEIIDAHHHFWNIETNYHPWLCDARPIPFRYGDYSRLKRNYLPDDYRADAATFDVAGSVAIEAEWNPADPLGELRWLEAVDDRLPSAIVAQAWLDRPDLGEVLDAYAAHSKVRGIRHKPVVATSPERITAGEKGSMDDPEWRAGFARLAPLGLSFDMQVPWWHLRQARRLADDFPDTSIIINHTALPSDRSAQGLEAWQRALLEIAPAQNVFIKISGLGLPGRPWSADDNAPIVRAAIDSFGFERCMFASNFPVDGLVASFSTIFDGFRRIVADLAPAEQAALFAGNARRIYRIGQASPPVNDETGSPSGATDTAR
ncbi:amidohydrolase family protein [Pelagibacterium montanilacus]|uniref:amidohydrolase family protein n=1 Tax=Pelagibacterium montanilacus TaxID=2185280 RepID=UPI000F8DE2B5|nr:amidohydrolase family protein [Pelagibacterium montanilacus]